MREVPLFFRVQRGELGRRSQIVDEAPYLVKALDAMTYREGVLIGQGKFTRHGEIFNDVVLWNPRKVAQNGKS